MLLRHGMRRRRNYQPGEAGEGGRALWLTGRVQHCRPSQGQFMATILSDRTVIYSGVGIQGAVAAIFGAYTSILVASYHYDLTLPQYGALFIPQVVAAFVAALFSTSLTTWLRAGDAYRVGLSCGLAGMVLLVATEWAERLAFTYPLLLVATALVGAGFGL